MCPSRSRRVGAAYCRGLWWDWTGEDEDEEGQEGGGEGGPLVL